MCVTLQARRVKFYGSTLRLWIVRVKGIGNCRHTLIIQVVVPNCIACHLALLRHDDHTESERAHAQHGLEPFGTQHRILTAMNILRGVRNRIRILTRQTEQLIHNRTPWGRTRVNWSRNCSPRRSASAIGTIIQGMRGCPGTCAHTNWSMAR